MFKNFLDGVTSYGTAISHVNKHRLWVLVLLPGVFSILIGIGIFSIAWGLSDNIGDLLDNLWPWEKGRSIVATVAQLFGGLLVLIFSLIVFKQLIMIISSPILSVLSEKVERQLLGKDMGNSFSLVQILSDVARGLRIALRNLMREVLVTLLLLLLGLIPLFTPFTTVLIFILQAYYAGFGNFDFALERRFRYRESVMFIHENRMLTIGNGIVFMLLLFTFVGFLVALPLGVVAATIEAGKRNLEIGN